LPSEKILQQKQQVVAELAEVLNNSVAGVLADYKGISVESDTKLRRELREADIKYNVIKNSILRLAFEKAGISGIEGVLVGSSALAVSKNDYTAAAKILSKYAASTRGAYKLKAGFIDGSVIDAAGVDELSRLPSREELVAKVLGGMNAPISGFVHVLNANITGLVVALNAVAEKKAS
jgi:large subunit ribosomal protein L10